MTVNLTVFFISFFSIFDRILRKQFQSILWLLFLSMVHHLHDFRTMERIQFLWSFGWRFQCTLKLLALYWFKQIKMFWMRPKLRISYSRTCLQYRLFFLVRCLCDEQRFHILFNTFEYNILQVQLKNQTVLVWIISLSMVKSLPFKLHTDSLNCEPFWIFTTKILNNVAEYQNLHQSCICFNLRRLQANTKLHLFFYTIHQERLWLSFLEFLCDVEQIFHKCSFTCFFLLAMEVFVWIPFCNISKIKRTWIFSSSFIGRHIEQSSWTEEEQPSSQYIEEPSQKQINIFFHQITLAHYRRSMIQERSNQLWFFKSISYQYRWSREFKLNRLCLVQSFE